MWEGAPARGLHQHPEVPALDKHRSGEPIVLPTQDFHDSDIYFRGSHVEDWGNARREIYANGATDL